jgi:hypothetical protein
MKKIILILLLGILLPVGLALGADPRGGGVDGHIGGGGGVDGRAGGGMDGHGGWDGMGITNSPKASLDRSHLLNTARERSLVRLPAKGPGGAPFHGSLVSPRNMNSAAVHNQMANITRDSAFTGEVSHFNAAETRAGQYYWHTFNGLNYCHYCDPWGAHWYGWYLGRDFFWTRFYWGYWWWYDPIWFRWCYWYDGWWWWQDPYDDVIYVYNNGQYVPEKSSASPVPGAAEYRSADGTRTVKMVGQDAFLYDTSGSNAFKPVFLGSGVKEVRFSNTSFGKPLQIMLELNDGTFQLFDDTGNPFDGSGGPPGNSK